jgi:hypothetical protein
MNRYGLLDSSISGNGTNCHTLERDSVFAQAQCGAGYSSLLEEFVELRTLVNKWPLVQSPKVRQCLVHKLPHSY